MWHVPAAAVAETPVANRIGLNINASGLSPDQVLNLCSGGASTYVIMNDPGLAQRVHDQTGAIVIARHNWPDDSYLIPGKLLPEWQQLSKTAPDVYHYWPNEPYIADDVHGKLALQVQFMHQLEAAGVKGCIGNFAVASAINEDQVEAGAWDDFLRTSSEWTNAGHGIVGIHEYMTGALPWGCAGAHMDPMDMTRGPLTGPEKWPDLSEIWDDYKTDWHLFRYSMLAKRAEVLKVEFPRMVLTECFWDRMPDLEKTVLPQLDAWRKGKPDPGDGIISQYPLFKRWFPWWDPVVAAVQQLQWCENTYTPHILGFCLFAVNKDPKWVNYNLLDWQPLLDAIPDIERES